MFQGKIEERCAPDCSMHSYCCRCRLTLLFGLSGTPDTPPPPLHDQSFQMRCMSSVFGQSDSLECLTVKAGLQL